MARQEIEVAVPNERTKLVPYEHHAKYYETDQMGIIHHSNYVKWMEEARLDLMDQIGLNYRQMEEMEIISPVLSISVEYHSKRKELTRQIDTEIKSAEPSDPLRLPRAFLSFTH